MLSQHGNVQGTAVERLEIGNCSVFVAWGGLGWACGTCGEGRDAHRLLMGKPEGKRPFGRSRRRWEHNICEVAWSGLMWLTIRASDGLL